MSETEAQQLARVTGVSVRDAERALNGPDLDAMYAQFAGDLPGVEVEHEDGGGDRALDEMYAAWAAQSGVANDEEEAET